MFKSKVTKIFDFRAAEVSGELLKIEVDQKEIVKRLEEIARKYSVTVEPEDGVMPGDMVMLEMESELEKYNKKNVPMAVGAGLFNKGFEEQLLNIKKGEEKVIAVDGHTVRTKILNIKRKMVPAVTDELVAKEGIEGVNSVQGLKACLFEEKVSKLKEERLVQINYEVLKQVAGQSEYLIEAEDIEALYEEEMSRCRALSKMEGLVFEEMTEKELGARVGFGNLEVFKEHVRKSYEKELRTALVGMSMAKEEKVVLDELSYQEHIKEMVEREAMDIEAARAIAPFSRYIAFGYTGFLRKKVSEYYGNKFQVI